MEAQKDLDKLSNTSQRSSMVNEERLDNSAHEHMFNNVQNANDDLAQQQPQLEKFLQTHNRPEAFLVGNGERNLSATESGSDNNNINDNLGTISEAAAEHNIVDAASTVGDDPEDSRLGARVTILTRIVAPAQWVAGHFKPGGRFPQCRAYIFGGGNGTNAAAGWFQTWRQKGATWPMSKHEAALYERAAPAAQVH